MGVKDMFEKVISYFATEEFEEGEETAVSESSEKQISFVSQEQPISSYSKRTEERVAQKESVSDMSIRQNTSNKQNSKSSLQVPKSRVQYNENENVVQTTIALKFPKKYEDAQEIVDLLIANECVLIDFQYMLDAQARRCIDFIDGASKVLYGKLRKVGSSMYLLTPPNVVVNIEEIAMMNQNQDFGFDYDMKRR